MIQQRRNTRFQHGSAKSNRTFDKRNGIKRDPDEPSVKDWEVELDQTFQLQDEDGLENDSEYSTGWSS